MPKIFGQGNNIKSKKEAKQIVLLIIIVMVCVVFAFSAVGNLQRIITNTSGVFKRQRIEVSSCFYYAVSVEDFDNLEDANNFAVKVKNAGGAGVVCNMGEFFVFSSVYPTLIEAQEIKENLKNLGYGAKIVNLKTLGLTKPYFGNNLNIFCKALIYFRKAFEQLYSLSIDFDKGEKTKDSIEKIITAERGKLAYLKSELLGIDEKDIEGFRQVIIKHLNALGVIFQDIINYPQEGFCSFLKFCCFNVIFEHQNLLKTLNNN